MAVTIDDVKHIAKLAKLKFTEDELLNFTSQMNEILEYMNKLNELDTDNVEPLSNPVEIFNRLREDKLKKSSTTEVALSNAPDATDKYFKVPKVINQVKN